MVPPGRQFCRLACNLLSVCLLPKQDGRCRGLGEWFHKMVRPGNSGEIPIGCGQNKVRRQVMPPDSSYYEFRSFRLETPPMIPGFGTARRPRMIDEYRGGLIVRICSRQGHSLTSQTVPKRTEHPRAFQAVRVGLTLSSLVHHEAPSRPGLSRRTGSLHKRFLHP